MSNIYLAILLIISTSVAIDVPNRGWISERTGIVVEPDGLIIHYDQVEYNTIGVKFALLPDLSNFTNASGCKLGPIRLTAIKTFNSSITSFFNSIPRHFSDFSSHYCKDGTIDCFLAEMNIDKNGKTRPKRQVILALLAVAGFAVMGTGIYGLISKHEIQTHMSMLDEKLRFANNFLVESSKTALQYNKVNEGLYTKLYHGTINHEKLLAESICKIAENEIYDSVYLHYMLYLETYKQNFLEAMDGKVNDFLISYDFLVNNLLKDRIYKNSAYLVDPGLFYIASTSLLTRLDIEHQMAYFTILTPILKEQDVSPLYQIYNLGWRDQTHLLKFDVPTHGYLLTDGRQAEIAAPKLDRCYKSKGIYLCNLKDSELSPSAQCLSNIILRGNHNSCPIKVMNKKPECTYLATKGGILVQDCDSIKQIHSFRGLPRHDTVKIPSSQTLFLPYSDFQQIEVNGVIVSSKGSYIAHTTESTLTIPVVNLSDISHLIIPGIEQDLSTLKSFREQSERTIEGYLHSILDQNEKQISWVVLTLGACGALNLLIMCGFWIRKMMPSRSSEHTDRLGEILAMRKMRREEAY